MGVVAVLGAGAGALAAVVELSAAGHDLRLWNRRAATLEPVQRTGAVAHTGLLGEGRTPLRLVSVDLAQVLDGADVALVCLPALAHEQLAKELAAIGDVPPVILSPASLGSSLLIDAAFARAGRSTPAVAELSTLPYVARKPSGDHVHVSGVAEALHAACLPGAETALNWATRLYPACDRETDVLATGLANVNLVLHPPAAVLGAAWVEATKGDFRFYADATTPGVARTIAALDAERLAVARAFGHDLVSLLGEMERIGTVQRGSEAAGDLSAIAAGAANAALRAPDSLAHRYYEEDVLGALSAFTAVAGLTQTPVPIAGALLQLGATACGVPQRTAGQVFEAFGLSAPSRDALLTRVRAAQSATLK
ncbi:MAG: octopine/nopaline dehydrogenase [Solirubrobacterales bacterium]|nr:octopine/nopaline dehydrogenase [Solirubrobacterales bacterium]